MLVEQLPKDGRVEKKSLVCYFSSIEKKNFPFGILTE